MSERTIDEIVANLELDVKNTKGKFYAWSNPPELLALSADWRKRGEALEPFVDLANKRDAIYRKRGGNGDSFPDTHPAYDIKAEELRLGVWRQARAALKGNGEADDEDDH